MSPQGVELELSEPQIIRMIETSSRDRVGVAQLNIIASDSYGPHMHRTWVFFSEGSAVIGSLERYWGGLKMICSLFGGSPRTNFFMEDGTRTTNKGLKTQ